MSEKCPRSGLMHCTRFASLDHLIGAAKQRWRDVDAELSRRLEINDQFELGGLHNRQVRRLFAFKNATDIDTCLTPRVCQVGTVTKKAASSYVHAANGDRRNPFEETFCDV